LDEILNSAPNRQAPYVAVAAFATKAGIHASGILNEPATYEQGATDAVGNRRRVLCADQPCKLKVTYELKTLGIHVGKDDPRVAHMLEVVKAREAGGYA